MPESLINPQPKDNSAVWFKLPNGSKRCFPRHAVAKMLADKNRGWELCDPEFVPEKQVRPYDDRKTQSGMKNANTEMTGKDLESFVSKSFIELKEIAVKEGVSIQGIRSKKGMLEKLEKEGKLY